MQNVVDKGLGGVVHFVYESPIGRVLISSDGGFVTAVKYSIPDGFDLQSAGDAITSLAALQLDEYFAGKRRVFDLPLRLDGTSFQRSVWEELQRIPYGQTRTYGQVAQSIGNPKASRAVGSANNRNPVSIIVPCHRVVGSGGALVGYAGGLDAKQMLLDLEKGQPL